MLFGGFSSFLPTNMYITIWFLRETLQRMEHYIIIVYNGIAWRTVRRPSPNNNFGAFSVLSYLSFIAEWMCAKHRVYEMTASNNRGFDLFSHFSREFDNFLITEFRFRFFSHSNGDGKKCLQRNRVRFKMRDFCLVSSVYSKNTIQ